MLRIKYFPDKAVDVMDAAGAKSKIAWRVKKLKWMTYYMLLAKMSGNVGKEVIDVDSTDRI